MFFYNFGFFWAIYCSTGIGVRGLLQRVCSSSTTITREPLQSRSLMKKNQTKTNMQKWPEQSCHHHAAKSVVEVEL
ncbi:unnamed protein product [Amoebophrya sp. A120]|nr:unnamed protein product [Amoebophrya sp. A120]|eukprot:GSA120T00007020001.1